MNVVATRSSTNASPTAFRRRSAARNDRAWARARTCALGTSPPVRRAARNSAWLRTLGAPITSVRQSWCGLGAE